MYVGVWVSLRQGGKVKESAKRERRNNTVKFKMSHLLRLLAYATVETGFCKSKTARAVRRFFV